MWLRLGQDASSGRPDFALPFRQTLVSNVRKRAAGRLASPEQPSPKRKPGLEVRIMASQNSSRTAVVPAVAYLRMSDKKQDKSIPAQQAEIEKYAAAHGFKVIRWY